VEDPLAANAIEEETKDPQPGAPNLKKKKKKIDVD